MIDGRLHHVGLIVPDIDRVEKLALLFGLKLGRRQYVPEYEAECIFTEGSAGMIEFIVPRGGKLTKFNKGLGGLHHVAIEVDDLAAVTDELRQQDVELLESEPVDAGPIWINFLSPISTSAALAKDVP